MKFGLCSSRIRFHFHIPDLVINQGPLLLPLMLYCWFDDIRLHCSSIG